MTAIRLGVVAEAVLLEQRRPVRLELGRLGALRLLPLDQRVDEADGARGQAVESQPAQSLQLPAIREYPEGRGLR